MDHHHYHLDVKLPEAVGILGPNGEVIPLDDPRAKRFEPLMMCKCPRSNTPCRWQKLCQQLMWSRQTRKSRQTTRKTYEEGGKGKL
ncbi:hypothetical protein BCY84_02011 [Trypanosoma cruzi cruzi]|nr:hypothetical protein BCY84_02011 [Trypanosoma cruzi cruzi]